MKTHRHQPDVTQDPAAQTATPWSGLQTLEQRLLMSVTLGADGFHDFAPESDTRIVYVSSSTGSDSNTGLSQNAAVKSIERGKALIRDNSADMLLFKRGDVWASSFGEWDKSGRGENQMLVVSTYGQGDRPVFLTSDNGNGLVVDDNVSHVAIVGLNFYADSRDPDNAKFKSSFVNSDSNGIRWFGGGQNVLIEDMQISFFKNNVTFNPLNDRVIRDLQLRRNIITDAYNNDKSQGLFIDSGDGILLEENVFDHNGWHTQYGSGLSKFNHNVYLQHGTVNVVARGNVFSNASSHGIQFRSGGVAENNLFFNNAASLLILGDGQALNNVILNSHTLPDAAGGWGMQLSASNGGSMFATGNLIARDDSPGGSSRAIYFGSNSTIVDNVVYDWGHGFEAVGTNLTGSYLANNTIKLLSGSEGTLARIDSTGLTGSTFANNTYDAATSSQRIRLDGWTKDNAWWKANYESTAQFKAVNFSNPDASLGSYYQAIAGQGSAEDLLLLMRHRDQGMWYDALSADAVNDYLRASFNMTESTTLPTDLPTLPPVVDPDPTPVVDEEPVVVVDPAPTPTPTPTPVNTTSQRIEGERMSLTGYSVQNNSVASNGKFAHAELGTTGKASFTYQGDSGTFNIVLGTFDESDGQATIALRVNGTQVSRVTLDQGTSSTRADAQSMDERVMVTAFQLNKGDVVELVGTTHNGEHARIDYLDLNRVTTPVTETPVIDTPVVDTPVIVEEPVIEPTPDPVVVVEEPVIEPTPDPVVVVEEPVIEPTPEPVAAVIRIEAESMNLTGYERENVLDASGLRVVKAPLSQTPSVVSTVFTGEAGSYDLTIAAYDESDGQSTLTLRVNGLQVGSVVLNADTGGDSAQASGRVTLTLATGLALKSGDRIEVVGRTQGQEHARIDYLELARAADDAVEAVIDDEPAPAPEPIIQPAPPTSVKLEVEDFDLRGFKPGQRSEEGLVYIPRAGSATAVTQYAGPSGEYELVAVYHDEADGVATAQVSINNQLIDSFALDQNLGGRKATADNRVERSLGLVTLNGGDQISLFATSDGKEHARFDYFELRPVASALTDASPSYNGSALSSLLAEDEDADLLSLV